MHVLDECRRPILPAECVCRAKLWTLGLSSVKGAGYGRKLAGNRSLLFNFNVLFYLF